MLDPSFSNSAKNFYKEKCEWNTYVYRDDYDESRACSSDKP